jgi:hypothetical protein
VLLNHQLHPRRQLGVQRFSSGREAVTLDGLARAFHPLGCDYLEFGLLIGE